MHHPALNTHSEAYNVSRYGRVISRIEAKTATVKLRGVVRSILMWIACATRPLREEELLQVLVIDQGEHDFTRGRKDYRNICQDCGPIIEVADGAVRFVHFSAKEYVPQFTFHHYEQARLIKRRYLLHEQSNRFLSLADAHLNAALTCATYLTYSSLDILCHENEENSDINSQILRGDFVFLGYATLEYMTHVKEWMRHRGAQDPTDTLCDALRWLFDARGNKTFDKSTPPKTFVAEFAPFKGDPALQRSLASASFFVTGSGMGMIELDGKHDSYELEYVFLSTCLPALPETTGTSLTDPLALFSALARFRQHLEAAGCDGRSHDAACPCQTLGKLYGSQRYYCRKLFCSFHVNGFATREARDRHLEEHSRNFKCPEPDCVFASTGFRSSLELSRHTESAHRQFELPVAGGCGGNNSPESSKLAALLPSQDRLELLEDAIKNNQIDTAQKLISSAEGVTTPARERNRLVWLAAQHSTPEFLAWLLDSHSAKFSVDGVAVLNEALYEAINAENLPNIKLLLSRGADIMTTSTPYYDYHSDSPALARALERWNGDLMRFLVRECRVALPPTWPRTMECPASIFCTPHLAKERIEEVRRRVAAMKPYVIWPETFRLGPYYAAQSGSPALITVSLENSGDPNGAPGGKFSTSPLTQAAATSRFLPALTNPLW